MANIKEFIFIFFFFSLGGFLFVQLKKIKNKKVLFYFEVLKAVVMGISAIIVFVFPIYISYFMLGIKSWAKVFEKNFLWQATIYIVADALLWGNFFIQVKKIRAMKGADLLLEKK